MPEDDEGLGFLLDLDLLGVKRAMDGRREGREMGGREGVGLGLYQCRPPRRRGRGVGEARPGERQLARRGKVGMMG